MRGTRAKQIRRDAVHMANRDLEVVTYEEKKHVAKLIPTNRFNPNGTPEMFRYVPVSVTLGDCERRNYQWFKEAYKAAMQAPVSTLQSF